MRQAPSRGGSWGVGETGSADCGLPGLLDILGTQAAVVRILSWTCLAAPEAGGRLAGRPGSEIANSLQTAHSQGAICCPHPTEKSGRGRWGLWRAQRAPALPHRDLCPACLSVSPGAGDSGPWWQLWWLGPRQTPREAPGEPREVGGVGGQGNMPETPLPSWCPRSLSDVVVQPPSHVRLRATPWTAARHRNNLNCMKSRKGSEWHRVHCLPTLGDKLGFSEMKMFPYWQRRNPHKAPGGVISPEGVSSVLSSPPGLLIPPFAPGPAQQGCDTLGRCSPAEQSGPVPGPWQWAPLSPAGPQEHSQMLSEGQETPQAL